MQENLAQRMRRGGALTRALSQMSRYFVLACWAALAAGPAAAYELAMNRYMEIGNSNRDPNWDWTQNFEYTLYTNRSPSVATVRLPYYSSTGPAARDLNISEGRDIQPSDGWVLVARDFGSPTVGATVPFFILYNKYRGLLRVYYWSTLSSTYSHAIAMLSFAETTPEKTAALMTFSGPTAEYVNSYEPAKAQIAIGDMEPQQWGYFDFDVSGYDPNLANKTDPTLVLKIAGVVESSIVLEGTIQTNDGSTTATKKGSANFDNAVGFYEKPAKRYRQIVEAQARYNEMASQNSDKWWAKYLQKIGNLGKTEWLKSLGPAIGFVEAVLGFGSSSSRGPTPLLIDATVKLNGTMSTETQIFTYSFRAPGARHADPVNDATSNLLPLYDRPLGVFNLLSAPTVTVAEMWTNWVCHDYFAQEWEPDTRVETCHSKSQQRLSRLDYVINPDSGLVIDAMDAAYLPAGGGLPVHYVEGSSDGYKPLCDLQATVITDSFSCPTGSYWCPEVTYDPVTEIRNIGLRVRLRAPAAPNLEPVLLMRKHVPGVTWSGSTLPAPSGCASPTSSASPFKYTSALDQYRACLGLSGGGSTQCQSVSDFNDRQMCQALATDSQQPCTSMTDRNLQLACYGMALAPSYPSNCRDITHAGLQDFCYSVSSWGSWASCSVVSDPAEKGLCQGLTYRDASFCAAIGNNNDRWFCYGTSSQTPAYCNNIVF